jgi:hypothetical protein
MEPRPPEQSDRRRCASPPIRASEGRRPASRLPGPATASPRRVPLGRRGEHPSCTTHPRTEPRWEATQWWGEVLDTELPNDNPPHAALPHPARHRLRTRSCSWSGATRPWPGPPSTSRRVRGGRGREAARLGVKLEAIWLYARAHRPRRRHGRTRARRPPAHHRPAPGRPVLGSTGCRSKAETFRLPPAAPFTPDALAGRRRHGEHRPAARCTVRHRPRRHARARRSSSSPEGEALLRGGARPRACLPAASGARTLPGATTTR